MSSGSLRPPRATPILALPIPGDSGPADYVTDTGALADAIDAKASPRLPRVTALPANPREGDEILFMPAGWHFRYLASGPRWEFLGGPPLISGTDSAGPMVTGWNPGSPELSVPLAGAYRGSFSGTLTATVQSTMALALGVSGPSGAFTVQGYNRFIALAAGFQGSVAASDVPITLVANGRVNMMFYSDAPTGQNSVSARIISVYPTSVSG